MDESDSNELTLIEMTCRVVQQQGGEIEIYLVQGHLKSYHMLTFSGRVTVVLSDNFLIWKLRLRHSPRAPVCSQLGTPTATGAAPSPLLFPYAIPMVLVSIGLPEGPAPNF
jgi:hypothetical protein